MSMMSLDVPERRRRDIKSRVARAMFPVRQSLDVFLDDLGDLPCKILGHKWVQVPAALTSRRARQEHRMRFKCSRCFLTAGFSN